MPEPLSLSDRERAAVLAGLRMLQWALPRTLLTLEVEDVLSDGGHLTPLGVDEIGALCERVTQ